MAEIRPVQVGANMLAGYQGAQQVADARQMNQLRSVQIQQATAEQKRDSQFRNQLSTYLQGGSNGLAALYATDPERAMNVQTFQGQQNELSRQKRVKDATEAFHQARGVLDSESPADYFRILMPDKAEMWAAQNGRSVEEITDEDAVRLATETAAMAGPIAGIGPEYSAPEAAQVGGRDVFAQFETTTGRPRVLEGVTPRPQKPLVEVSTGAKFEAAAEKAYGTAEGKAFSALQELGQSSQDQNSTLRAMMQNPAITGPTQDFRASANAFFSDLGVPISADKIGQIANLGQYKAMQQSTVLNEQLKQKGPQTETDRKTIQETFANTKNVKEANELILKYKLAVNDRNALLAEMTEEYRTTSGKLDGWRTVVRDYVNSNPLAGVNPNSKRLVFWNEFQDQMRDANPTMSEAEIMTEWRKKYAR